MVPVGDTLYSCLQGGNVEDSINYVVSYLKQGHDYFSHERCNKMAKIGMDGYARNQWLINK
jgi:hypothetical protein